MMGELSFGGVDMNALSAWSASGLPCTYRAPSSVFTTAVEILGHGSAISGPIGATGTAAVAVYDVTIDSPAATITTDTYSTIRLERVTTNAGIVASGPITLIDFKSSGYLYSYWMATLRRASFVAGTASSYFSAGWDVENSVFARNPGGITFTYPDASRPQRFENNTVVDNGSSTMTSGTLDTRCLSGAGNGFRNNIVWSSFTPDPTSQVTSNCNHTYSLVYTGTSSAYPGTGNLLGDPAFVRISPSGSLPADFHLTAASVARDTADPSNPLADDMDGDARPANGRADIGADEYLP